jgi:hypothetical protein
VTDFPDVTPDEASRMLEADGQTVHHVDADGVSPGTSLFLTEAQRAELILRASGLHDAPPPQP